jgi:hypothetical protein
MYILIMHCNCCAYHITQAQVLLCLLLLLLLPCAVAEVVSRAEQGLVSQAAVESVAQALAAINHNSKPLKQYLQSRSSSTVSA